MTQNPMYIEFELNNDEEEDDIIKIPRQDAKVHQQFEVTKQNNALQDHDYNRLESSRKEERRLFSPPFKQLSNGKEDLKIEKRGLNQESGFMKVQKAQILRDSLDMSPSQS